MQFEKGNLSLIKEFNILSKNLSQVQPIINQYSSSEKMNKRFAAGNSRGFSSSIQSGHLPDHNHITFEGVFNELKFDVGHKTSKQVDLQFGYSRYHFPKSTIDPNINDYLALFVTGESDGKDRDDRRLNSIICLDISGSMDGQLSRNSSSKQNKSRLSLSLQAIKMFISKLRPSDAFGIVIFDTIAETYLPMAFKSNIDAQIYEEIDKIKCRGGTQIRCGFELSKNQLTKWLSTNGNENCQNRIIMLTDVCDNSLQGEVKFIEEVSLKSNINLTIVGISSDFQSSVCQKLKDIKGFSYFCAVNDDDIKKYVYQEFDFSFFPSVYNLEISIASEDLSSFQVFGVPDADKVAEYNNHFTTQNDKLIITKAKSSFPSAIEVHGDRVFTEGGLILLKLNRRSKNPFFKAEIAVTYENLKAQVKSENFSLNYQFHQEEQFFSNESLREAVEGYIFVSQLKNILKLAKSMEKKLIYQNFWEILHELRNFTPKSKLQDLQNTITIVTKFKEQTLP